MDVRTSNSRIRVFSGFTLALLLFCVTAPGYAFRGKREKQDEKRQVERLEEQWRTAQLSGDVVTMDKLLSDDYVGISMTGQVNTKAQQLSRIRNHKFILTRLDLTEMKVKLLGQVAIVTVRAAIEGTNEGAPISGNFRYTRIYQHLPDGGWKITNFEATRIPGMHHEQVGQSAENRPG